MPEEEDDLTETEDPGDVPPAGERDYESEIKKLRAENAKHRTRNKELQSAADQLAEIENANKSATEKAAEQAAAALKRAEDAESKLMRLEIASEKGLPKKLANRLRGGTREELEADADELMSEFGGSGNGQEPRARVTPNLRPGGASGDDDGETDPAKLAAAIPRR